MTDTGQVADWAATVYSVGAGVGLVLIGLALVVLVFVLIPLVRDLRRLAADTRRLVGLTETELRPTLAELRQSAATLAQVTQDARPTIARLDSVLDDAQRTMHAVRSASGAVTRFLNAPAMGMSQFVGGLRRAFGGRAPDRPVESPDETQESAG